MKRYWLVLFSGSTWMEFLDAGASVMGFKEHQRKTVQKLQRGDFLICYLTGVCRFVAILEVLSEPYESTESIWAEAMFPHRVKVRTLVDVPPEVGVPVSELKSTLSIFERLESPTKWGAYFQSSLSSWKLADGEVVFEALKSAKNTPVIRPLERNKLNRPAKRKN